MLRHSGATSVVEGCCNQILKVKCLSDCFAQSVVIHYFISKTQL